ncbi:MAG: ATP phosphoribosyltransferase regulatory subunit [Pseudomonadota bacterium]
MQPTDSWLLPEGIDEALPDEAERLEALRRTLVDLHGRWGYRLVMPPLIEYLESLLTGTGNDLDLQTFKLTDQLSGRMLGVRADMTPQVARMDAHRLGRDVPERLCYQGTVLRTRPENGAHSRAPLQVGAELFGHAGIESDVEIMTLMVASLQAVGLDAIHLDLGHVGIYRGLVAAAEIEPMDEERLFDALQRKARPELPDILEEAGVQGVLRQLLLKLPDLHGDRAILDEARELLGASGATVVAALDELEGIAAALVERLPGVTLHFDLGELRGYRYHTGVVFAAMDAAHGRTVAMGGRYDDIGGVFGRARPATGFSADLRELAALTVADAARAPVAGIFAPWVEAEEERSAWQQAIDALRAAGERVVVELPEQGGDAGAMGCDRRLVRQDGQWQVVPVVGE